MRITIKRLAVVSIIIFLSALYLYLRVGFPETIEFGYDQPRIATWVLSMMENGDYLDALRYIPTNPFGQRSCFNLFLYFLMPFFMVSRDPVVVSVLIALYSGLALILFYFLAKKLFGSLTAFLATLLIVVNPWHVVFSRMIYNPAFSLPLIILGYYLLTCLGERKKWVWILLPLVLGSIFQVYVVSGFSTALMIIVLILAFFRKEIDFKRLIVGLFLGLTIWIPLIRSEITSGFAETNRLLMASEVKGDQTYIERGVNIITHFINNSTYRDFNFELGYAYNDFTNGLSKIYKVWSVAFYILVIASLFYLLARVIYMRSFSYVLVFCWILAPLAFSIIYMSPEIVPRYFWVYIPPVSIVIADFVVKLSQLLLRQKSWLAVSVFGLGVIVFNVYFIISFYKFVINYDGYKGLLSGVSDPPVVFSRGALEYAEADGRSMGYDGVTISSPNWSVNFIRKYVLKKTEVVHGKRYLNYVIADGGAPEGAVDVVRFGPYVVYHE